MNRRNRFLPIAVILTFSGCGVAPENPSAQTSGTVSVDGAELRYVVEGEGRPCIVIGSEVYYRRAFSARFKEHLRCAYMDTRMFTPTAGADSDNVYDMDTVVDDAEQVRRATGFGSVIVVGHSMHALIALEYARKYPDHVTGVVMLGMSPVWGDGSVTAQQELWEKAASPERKRIHQQRRQQVSQAAMAQLGPGERFIQNYITDGALYWYDPTYDCTWLWSGIRLNMDLFNQFAKTSLRGYDITRGPEVTKPVFVAVGRHDYIAPHVLWDERTKAPLTRLTYHLFERSGHTPQTEEPELFDARLIEWLNGRQARPPIIDMHLHAQQLWTRPGEIEPLSGLRAAASTDELQRATLEALKRYNIVKAVASGPWPRRIAPLRRTVSSRHPS